MKAAEFLLEAGEPTNPSRRGFLKKAGAGAVAASMPGQTINHIIDTFTKDVGGTGNIKIMSELLKKVSFWELSGIIDALGSGITKDAWTPEESKLVDNKIEQIANQQGTDPYDVEQELDDKMMDSNEDYSVFYGNLVGKKFKITEIEEILNKYNTDRYEFFDDEDVINAIKDATNKAHEAIKNAGVASDDLVSIAKDARLSGIAIRIAGFISSMMSSMNKPAISSNDITPNNTTPDNQLALPAPSAANTIEPNLNRMKDLAGIKQNKI